MLQRLGLEAEERHFPRSGMKRLLAHSRRTRQIFGQAKTTLRGVLRRENGQKRDRRRAATKLIGGGERRGADGHMRAPDPGPDGGRRGLRFEKLVG
jgi:hypothetical protein